VVTGHGSNQCPDDPRGQGDGEPDEERDPSAVQHTGELVPPELVGPEPVVGAGRLHPVQQVLLSEPELGDGSDEDAGQSQEEQDDRTDDGELVPLEPPPRKLAGGEDPVGSRRQIRGSPASLRNLRGQGLACGWYAL